MTGHWNRRQFIGTVGMAASVLPLAGCPVPTVQPPKCLGTGPTPHQRIDAHVHVFNGTDLQIAGFLKKSVANDIEYQKVAPILRAVADPLQDFVWAFSPTAQRELDALGELAFVAKRAESADAALRQGLTKHRAETSKQYSEFLLKVMRLPEVRDAMAEVAVSRDFQAAPRDPPGARAMAQRFQAQSGTRVFDYLEPFFSYRYSNYYELADTFTCSQTARIDTFVGQMVDYDQALGTPGHNMPSHIDDQALVMSKICQLSRGRLLAMAPYCPLKDAAQKGASLKNVCDAWKLPGFVGAKLYPPMGFTLWEPAGPVHDALTTFFDACIDQDAAVLAHSGPSQCVVPGDCTFPNPMDWATRMSDVYSRRQKSVRATFGHFGGVFDNKPYAASWPKAIVDLMGRPEGARVYADLSYASTVLDPTKHGMAAGTLAGLLTQAGSPLADRLIYGSDWIMLGLEPTWRTYADNMDDVITQAERKASIRNLGPRLFGTNARAWLGLDEPTSLAARNVAKL